MASLSEIISNKQGKSLAKTTNSALLEELHSIVDVVYLGKYFYFSGVLQRKILYSGHSSGDKIRIASFKVDAYFRYTYFKPVINFG